MRLASLCLVLVSLASAALGQTPGVVVQKGEPFPIVAFTCDGLDGLGA